MFKYRDVKLRASSINLSLKEIIIEVIDELQGKADGSNIDLKLDIEDKYALGVKSEVRAIIFNLLDNAIKYSKNKKVHLMLYEDRDKVKFEIFNKCKGIPKTILDRFINKFIGFRRKNREVGSIGLGLFICRQLAELNEGSVDFNYGKNNLRFILTLKKAL